ncbi:MFS transporter [Paenibacillus glycanilyticus]|uniref:MFS-type transporter YkuC n=1 Tax=Paenibacillus glycanilyticus TaxID=126569 RepID=A0ABQ6GLB1_9BACL|nr:MFS transporter [Paenibacillus glycanilyticus]GLX71048.1 putative MFS-type transporter YkuC [Paenibacillus glycanilyticus]
MLALLGNLAFRRLFAASVASQLGTVIGNMAFAYYLVDRFASRPSLASVAELMYSLPTLVVFWIVGVIADRFDRKHIAAYSDWIRALLTMLLLIGIHYDFLSLCFALLFLRSAVSRLFGPAEMGLVQGSLLPAQYVQAAGFNQMVNALFMLFGLSLGAAAYYWLGITGALLIDAISFVISGLLISTGRYPEAARIPNGKSRLKELKTSLIWSDLRQGFQYIYRNKLLFHLLHAFFFFGIVNGTFAVLPIFVMKYKLSPDNYLVHSSLIMVFLGVGFMAGSLMAPFLIQKFSKTNVLIAGFFIASMLTFAIGSVSSVPLYLGLILLIGVILAPANIVIGGWMPDIVIPQYMGKVNALTDPLMMLGHSLALGFVALAFPSWISITWLHYMLGICMFGVSIYYFARLPRLIAGRKQERSDGVSG